MKQFKIEIPNPCREDWEQMTPESKGRFCGSCEKIVIDFTGMSAREIGETLKKQKNVCGRFSESQLQQTYFYPNKEYHFFPYTSIAAGLLLFLSPLTVSAQPKSPNTQIVESKIVGEIAHVPIQTYELEIKIVDIDSLAVPNLDLTMHLDKAGNKITARTNNNGVALFKLDEELYSLEQLKLYGSLQFYDEKLPIAALKIHQNKSTLIINLREINMQNKDFMVGKFIIKD